VDKVEEKVEEQAEEEEGDYVPLYVKISKDDAEILEKMTPLLYHYNLIERPTKRQAITYAIRLTALMLKKMLDQEGGKRE